MKRSTCQRSVEMEIVYYVLLIGLLLLGWFVNILGLPGLWLMVVGFVGYAFATGWNIYVGWQSIIALVLLAVTAEALEFFAGAAGSAKAGGRKRGMIGAIIGGFVGGILGTPIIPVIGTIVGACAGTFIGAAVMEFYDRDAAHSLRVGFGAAKGRLWGMLYKLSFGLIMFVVAAWSAWPENIVK